ncbi:MAG: glycoside hydrolase family 140 protein [Verrucomicrobiota bacterium]
MSDPVFSNAPRLRVSDNRRFLVTADGRPFFWLGDTAWELFHRLDREEAGHYLRDRAAKGFTVIQAVALAERDGLNTPDPNGNVPFANHDPARPVEAYWRHVDEVIALANSLGLIVALLPTWGDKWNQKHGSGPEIFTPENAAAYGEWLGRRYRDAGLVWVLGGDRPVETDTHRAIIREMAAGLHRGDGGAHLRTFHSQGACGSAEFFHDEPWLDFNFRQNGHAVDYTGRYDRTRADYDRTPVKPVLDGEPVYEDIGIDFNAARHGHAGAADVRRALYWNLFTGACGHTYGHNSVWQMWAPGREPVLDPLMSWREALDRPGAGQMQHARRLLESRPFLTRIPDQAVLAPHPLPNVIPGAGRMFFAATRDAGGSYAMVYAPVGRAFTVNTRLVTGRRLRAWWFNPRDGSATLIDEADNTGERAFTPPDEGEAIDWVLVIDDVARGFNAPGV